MNLENIKKEIEKKGYNAIFRKEDNNWLQCFIPINIENNARVIAFGVRIETKNIILWDATKQIQSTIIFNNETKLIDYIVNNFTIT